ncbi:hypothetical protein ERJ75_000478600 [Trypanosoma vivax]|nr:hypothetical protein ERJ75_000478600 [Trypanosoma vivax]
MRAVLIFLLLCVFGIQLATVEARWPRNVDYGSPLRLSAASDIFCPLSLALREVGTYVQNATGPDGDSCVQEHRESIRSSAVEYATLLTKSVKEFFDGNKRTHIHGTACLVNDSSMREKPVLRMDVGGIAKCLENATVGSRNLNEAVQQVQAIVGKICSGHRLSTRHYVKNNGRGLFGEPAGCYLTDKGRLDHMIGGEPLFAPLFRVDTRKRSPSVVWLGGCRGSAGILQELLDKVEKLNGSSRDFCKEASEDETLLKSEENGDERESAKASTEEGKAPADADLEEEEEDLSDNSDNEQQSETKLQEAVSDEADVPIGKAGEDSPGAAEPSATRSAEEKTKTHALVRSVRDEGTLSANGSAAVSMEEAQLDKKINLTADGSTTGAAHWSTNAVRALSCVSSTRLALYF